MSLELTPKDTTGYVAVNDELTIYTVALHKEKLVSWTREFRHLVLDMSKVTEVDGAGVQLLLLLRAEAQKQQVQLVLAAPNEAVMQALGLLRLTDKFSLTDVPQNGEVGHG